MTAQLIRDGKYTRVFVCDKPGAGGACHEYTVENARYPNDPVVLGQVSFQNGPIQEAGVNGVQNEDLLAIVIHRLEGFQSGKFPCEENANALSHVRLALTCLNDRTFNREKRGVEGKNEA